ncbi:ABC transporter C family member 13 [Nymphaea colorata]|uniref:ABC transporter C family member 13 n=1 Tax=Nymphaea colorata TaxID=210225 RepID=UPI00129EDC6C|nr:ABC transporter C family member 13 [Nymphaea colorata]
MGLHKIMNKANSIGDIDLSIAKIEEYLCNQEKDRSYIARGDNGCSSEIAVSVKSGNFYWDREEENNAIIGKITFSLRDISLSVRKGEFAIFIGKFGSGKSSVINALLGEMNSESSNITLNGSIAYANQVPWVINDTVRNNILFGRPYDEKKYRETLHFSHLEADLLLFGNGDSTVIGERGSTLSGGQRARISLARTLYSEADIYILDDVLSALDAHVSSFIFQ